VVRHRALKVVATGVVATLVAAFVVVGERVRQLEANMQVIDITTLIGNQERPAKRAPTAEAEPLDPFGGNPVNILITAIDTRSGANADVVRDSMDSLLNDVNMVAHISADRSRVDIVSLPRDALVNLPACTTPNGWISPPEYDVMLNSAFVKGAGGWDPDAKAEGIACIFASVEAITGILLDAFILVDFSGFASVVDALDGVDICVPQGLVAQKTRLELTPGMHHLDGATALQFARTREGKTYDGQWLDGTDIMRINRQQQLVATVINEILAAGDLKSLPKLNATATAITSSLYVSPELGSVGALAGLAFALRNIKMDHVSLFTPPFAYEGQRVRLTDWGQSDKFGGLGASELFELFALDQPIPGTVPYKLVHGEAPEVTDQPSTTPASPDPADPTAPADPANPDPPTSATPAADDDFVTAANAPVTCEVVGQGDTG
jgi:LCP family protein required for cell wall assembly